MRISTLLAVAACLGENSCISFYRFYHYSDDWGVFLGHVPLHVVLIWPLFILGEHRYLRSLKTSFGIKATLCVVDVVLLANLVEMVCVAAGLWTWKESNCLGVPFIGVLGWALFATPLVLLLERKTMVLWSLFTLHGGLVLLWHLFSWQLQVSPAVEAMCITVIQFFYHFLVRDLPRPKLREEVPRLAACGILSALLLKGKPDSGMALVALASMLRLLAFEL